MGQDEREAIPHPQPAATLEAETLEAAVAPEMRSHFSARVDGRVPWLEVHLPGLFRAGFSTRSGGVSAQGYAELNTSYWVGDETESVDRNLEILGTSLGFTGEDVVLPWQVHGLEILQLDECRRRGGHPQCDGLILQADRDAGKLALMISGDCLTVLLLGRRSLGLIHAGWRGLRDGILQKGVAAMAEDKPFLAVFGPAIGPCCYPVGEDVAREVETRLGPQAVVRTQGQSQEQPRLDLWSGACLALEEAGLEKSRVVNPRLCTACRTDLFYSHRREGPRTGRHTAVAWVEAGRREER